MSGSREGTSPSWRARRPWHRLLLALALGPAATALLSAASADATPTPLLTPTPPQGTLHALTTDPSNNPVTVPGAIFQVHRGSQGGAPVGPPIVTDGTGTATAQNLELGFTYCAVELAPPPGYRLAPTYMPANGCRPLYAKNPSATVRAADPPNATPTPTAPPTPTPTPTPAATAMATGELQVIQTDLTGVAVTMPGFTFNVSVGSTTGQVIATISTDGTGRAFAGALNPSTYCVTETAAPDGFQLSPTYSPSACVTVVADPTQGRSPSTITVSDPPSATPTPSASAAAAALPSQAPPSSRPTAPRTSSALPVAALAKGLIAFGVILLLVGGTLVALEIRRRRRRAALDDMELPPDTWYDSTIT